MTKIKANQADIEDILNDPSAGATTTKKGSVEIATQFEVDTGTDTERSITPSTLSNFGGFEPADSTILKDADIGVTVQAFDATILNDADIGVNIEAFITKNTAFNLNFGTAGGEVSEGNHTHALDDLTDVVIGGSPLLAGHTLTYDGANWINQTPDSGVIDHLLLSNIGTNTHAQIDTHISDSTIHFSTLDGLSDVVLGSPLTDQVLKYNGNSWINADASVVFTLDANDTLFAGTGAGASLTTGPDNFLAGAGAGTLIAGGGHNVAIGNDALAAVTTTNDTIGIGRNTLKLCTGNNNVAIGGFAGYRMTTSSINNVLIGLQAGAGLVGTGNSDNIAIGTSALGNLGSSNTTTIRNIAIGSRSLDTLNGGDRNVAIGYNALTALTTGTDNTSVGDSSGVGITSGTGNVFLGTGTGWTNVSNELYIHNAASATPLIHGDFFATVVTINGTLIATGGVDALTSATTVIDVSSAAAPTTGQVLTATTSTTAVWQTPSGGGSPVITVLDDLADVVIGGSPLLTGHTLTYDGANWINQTPASGITDHTLLSNIGTNTHVQIDTHISAVNPHNNWMVVDNNTDVGTAPTATGANAIAIGNASSASGVNSIGIGQNADGGSYVGVAIGDNVTAGSISVAIGATISTNAAGSVAIGHAASSGGTDSTAIGKSSSSGGLRSVSLGNSTSGGIDSVAIGNSAQAASNNSVVLGNGASATGTSTDSVVLGRGNDSFREGQVSIGADLDGNDVTTDYPYSTKIGFGTTGVNKNFLHLHSKGKLELYGDEAQYIFPSYAVTGSPIEVPANSIEGGVIYDSTAKGLQLYDGASWSAIGGGGGGISAVVEDTDPHLGGNLDTNGYSIVTASSAVQNEATDNITITVGSHFHRTGNAADYGNFTLTAGNNSGYHKGGTINLVAGDGLGGSVGFNSDAEGGDVNLTAGDSAQSIGGNINLLSGDGNTTGGTGGAINITSGTGSLNSNDPAGVITISGGNSVFGKPGNIVIVAGDGTAKQGQAGDVSIAGGAYSYATTKTYAGRVGGNVSITGGLSNPNNVNSTGGSISIQPGTGSSTTSDTGGPGAIKIHSAGQTDQASIEIYDDANSFKTTLGVPVLTADTIFTLPADNGTVGQVLSTSGAGSPAVAGITSWIDPPAASLALDDLTDVVVAGSPAVTDQVLTFDGSNWVNSTPGVVYNWISGNNGADFDIAPSATIKAVAAGRNATASGLRSTAFGYNAQATNTDSIAMGTNARATTNGSVSIGVDSDATGSSAVAVGDQSQSLDTNSIAMGYKASATKIHSIAIGQRTVDSTTGTGRNVLIGAYASTFGTGDRNVAIGQSAKTVSGSSNGTVVGEASQTDQTFQTVIGSKITSADVTTDVPYSLKIGVGDATNLNIIHLHTKGHLELYGDEAQIVFPNYIVTGSPFDVPASADEGAVIYDSVAKGLQLYGGSPAGWSAIGAGGGSVALNDLTDVTLGSPVTNEVLTFDGSNWVNSTPGVVNNWITANNGVDFTTPPSAPQAGEFDIAIGDSAVANGSTIGGAIAIGSQAVGFLGGAQATAGFSTAVGSGSAASGQSSIAIGASALASGSSSFAVAGDAIGTFSVAMPGRSTANNADDITIGQYASTGTGGARSIAIGRNATTSNGVDNAVVIGSVNTAALDKQVIIGNDITGADVTSDVAYSVKFGTGTADANKNMLHLYSKGKLELYGDEAQYIFPSYAVTGSPIDVPANSVEGGVIYDSVAKGLQIYGGSPAGWSAIGGGGASNNWIEANDGSNFATAPDSGFDGSNNIAIGHAAIISTSAAIVGAIAIGHTADVGATRGIAIGQYADASDKQGVSIGFNTEAGYDAVALGNTAKAIGSSGQIAIGKSATANVNRSIAIGQNAAISTNSTSAIALGESAHGYGLRAVAVGRDAAAAGNQSGAFGSFAKVDLDFQFAGGTNIDSTSVTTDVSHSAKLGYGTANTSKNLLHLHSKGKLELYGDEAQYIFPSYAVTGSPIDVPANSVEGGVIYDSTSKALQLYDGAGWAAVGDANKNWVYANSGVNFTTTPIGTGSNSISIGESASTTTRDDAIAIGNTAVASQTSTIAIGPNSSATAINGVAIGNQASAASAGVSIGFQADAKAFRGIAIGSGAYSKYNDNIAIGNSSESKHLSTLAIGNTVVVSGYESVSVGHKNIVNKLRQTVIGIDLLDTSVPVTFDIPYSTKLGFGETASADFNMLHLFAKGKLELYGDEAQFVFPSYAVTGSPIEVPANSVEGGVIYDSTSKALQLYDGAGWAAVGGGAGGGATVLNDLTDVVIGGSPLLTDDLLTYDGANWINKPSAPASTKPTYEAIVVAGSPVSAVVTTTVSTVALTGNPLLAGLLVFRNGAQQSEGVMAGSPLQPSEDFAVTGANELTFGTGVLEVGNKINIYVFE